MNEHELSIVIPFYNEEGNIRIAVKTLANELTKNKINYELILINNGSSDNTPKIIKEIKKRNPLIKQVDIPKNIGYGWGIISGLGIAKGNYLGFIDGDNQLHPKYVVAAYNKIKETNAALCMTRRLKRPNNFLRQIVSAGYNLILNWLFFINVQDVNSKPKIFQQKFYKELSLASKDWFIDTEIVLKAKRNNSKIVEVPVVYTERKEGKSKVRLAVVKEFLVNILKYILHKI